MAAIEPVTAAVVANDRASGVVAPAYDSLSTDERAAFAESHPESYLHVNRSADRGAGHPAQHRRLASSGAEALERLRNNGSFSEVGPARLFVQRLRVGDQEQLAIIGRVTAGSDVQIRPHELTYPARVQALVEHFRVTGVMSSPVMVTSRHGSDAGAAIIAAALHTEPLVDAQLDDGARLTLWSAGDAQLPCDDGLYILDGHHRVAAAHGARLRSLLVAWVDPSQVHVGAFDRLVDELPMTPRRVVENLRKNFEVESVDSRTDAVPSAAGEIGIGVGGDWYRLVRRGAAGLDSEVVQRDILEGVLDLGGPTDPALTYRPSGGAAADASITLLLAPVELTTVLDVADAGGTMPPKSTYLLPKLRSGVLISDCRH
ncbi:MAG: hypothetical protein ACI8Y4_003918 [Candidatus Poriferisodalaceae bacterium]